MADILENHIDDRDINTVDSFLLDKFKTIFPDYSLDPYYKVDIPLGDLVKLNEKELLVEIEDFLLAGNVTESEYVKTDGIIRSGMKIKGLKVAEREQVWSCFIKYIHELEDKKTVTFPYLRYKLLNYLLEHPGDKNIRDVQYMFVDEVQDMTPASLAALKELTIGIIVMAGDNNQKIFASTSPYKRAGINLHGSTFTLNENFRNTNQILNFANSFLKQHNDKIDLEVIDSYRDGPLPEVNVIKGSITKAITDQLRIYIDDLGYEKHNIAIIVNSLRDATTKKLLKALESENISYVDTSEANFDFSQENAVRITTLHSCKGLDFPVVLLSIPYIKEPKDYDSETNDEILRNLLYVAFTRAMDNLNIFIKDKPKGILKDIVDCYEEIKGRFI
ncbi:hypothetical protein EW093_00910 [Thiospirochaeta perfilievii]|uniref:DNA 3'-5' helicase n=1 Tax=Thiospirochaeta perfilievii TaxID=252967 RepID=A0A5C1Q5J0_9SPIO|nr:3'-5' exonuclease [Thiospirochaeta perfilievii]QEN03323.1 hypothetical protein EW093_00910 [Thiospirochaeta perfilievii]